MAKGYISYCFKCNPTPRKALSVGWYPTIFTPSNAHAHQSYMWACALDDDKEEEEVDNNDDHKKEVYDDKEEEVDDNEEEEEEEEKE